MSYESEFATVDLIIGSATDTRGVDAFALTLIKAERQARRLFTHLVYQFPCFGPTDICALRAALWGNRRVYFDGFERGFDALAPHGMRELLGDRYDALRARIDEAIDHRNKLFHGQLTSARLTRDDLLRYVVDIRSWCSALAIGSRAELGYDGFERDSFRKSSIDNLFARLKLQFLHIGDYEDFISAHMQQGAVLRAR